MLRNAFEGLATDAKIDMMILLLAEIAEKMPRVDANDRMIVNTGDQGNVTVALAASQTLGTLTTASTLVTLQNLGNNGALMRDTGGIPTHVANIGALHLYDKITVV